MEIEVIVKILGKSAIICAYSYLLGSIPFGKIAGKIRGIDIQKVGSRKTGATNVNRSLGSLWGVGVAILDAGKAVLAVVLTGHYFPGPWLIIWLPELFTGLAIFFTIFGHIFPVWLRFKGGAGVGTFAGGLLGLLILGLLDWQIFLIILAGWLFVLRFIARKQMSTTNLIMVAILLLFIATIPILLAMSPLILGAVGLIWWAHRENIKRIASGKESSLKLAFLDKIPLINKIPDDVIGWAINKLQTVIVKLQNLQNQKVQKKP